MQVSWRNGFKKELKIGNKTWLIKKKENKANLNLNTNKLRYSMKRQLKKLMRPQKKLMMVSTNLKRL
jgi:hypothetical protein